MFDTDGSGYIDETELAFALKSIGYSKVTKADIDFVMEDVGGEDRKINFKEFCTKVQSNNADAGGPQEIKLAFKMFDEEGSGAITYDNLARVAELVEGRPADEAFLKSVIKSADFDHDGALNYSEFEHAVTKYKRKQVCQWKGVGEREGFFFGKFILGTLSRKGLCISNHFFFF